jgi:lysophospholipase L1-like esterase
MLLQDGQTLLFVGDSITDCGRARPFGHGDGLGEGYVCLVDSLLASIRPDQSIKVLNTGIGGNRITDLEARWQSDVLDLKPDWLSIMIGINDVWRQFDNAADPGQVTPEYFESALRQLVDRVQSDLSGLVLMTPFFIESNRADPMRTMMDQYGALVKRVAVDVGAHFVDTQVAYDRYLVHRPASSLAEDRVHPGQVGHLILAKAFLESVGFNWS